MISFKIEPYEQRNLFLRFGQKHQYVHRYFLLIVRYQIEDDGKRAYDDFVTHYLPELAEERVVRIEDGTWTGCQLVQNHLIAVFHAPAKESADTLIEEVQQKLFRQI